MPRPRLDLASTSLRERAAAVLLGYCAVVLLVGLGLLVGAGEPFATSASALNGMFLDPVLALFAVAAVLLVAQPEPARSRHARPVVRAAVAVLGAMVGLGLLTWLSALAAGDGAVRLGGLGGGPLAGGLAGSLVALAGLVLVAAALAYAVSVQAALPGPSARAEPVEQRRPAARPDRPVAGQSRPAAPDPAAPDPAAPDPAAPDPAAPDPAPDAGPWGSGTTATPSTPWTHTPQPHPQPPAEPAAVDAPTQEWSAPHTDPVGEPGAGALPASQPHEADQDGPEPGPRYTWVQEPAIPQRDGAGPREPDDTAERPDDPADPDDDRPIWRQEP